HVVDALFDLVQLFEKLLPASGRRSRPDLRLQKFQLAVTLINPVFYAPFEDLRNQANQRDDQRKRGNDDQDKAVHERRKPEGKVALPERNAVLVVVPCVRAQRKRIILVDRKLIFSLKDAGLVVHLCCRLQKKVGKSGMQRLANQ